MELPALKPMQILEQSKNTFMSVSTQGSITATASGSVPETLLSRSSAPFTEATPQSSEAGTVCVNPSSQM